MLLLLAVPLPAGIQQLPNLTLGAARCYWSSVEEKAAWQSSLPGSETRVAPQREQKRTKEPVMPEEDYKEIQEGVYSCFGKKKKKKKKDFLHFLSKL